MDYQIRQESLNTTQPEVNTDSKRQGKLIKSNNYANPYDSTSPYSKGPKTIQSIESIMGI